MSLTAVVHRLLANAKQKNDAYRMRAMVLEMMQGDMKNLSEEEYMYIGSRIARRAPCRFLVFGVGKDSGFWRHINAGGETVFLEDIPKWTKWARDAFPGIDVQEVQYSTVRSQWKELLVRHRSDPFCLEMQLPAGVAGTHWDCIFVDSPKGYCDSNPGRMQSFAAAARLGAHTANVDIFLHDCLREVERAYADALYTRYSLVAEIRQLRHYQTKS